MNEQIDLLLTSAKLVTRGNPWPSIATRAISSGYNAAMIGKYRYELSLVKAGVVSCSVNQIHSLQRDLTKYCVLEVLDVFGLFIGAFPKK